MVDHVLNRAVNSARYINRHTHRTGVRARVFLLIPNGDSRLATERPGMTIIEGDEHDVLSRYEQMQDISKGDFICRITADCPLVPGALMTKAIMAAVKGPYDFVSNAMPGFRTYPDGHDVEVMSCKLFDWVSKKAIGAQREHVTNILWKEHPPWANMAHLFNYLDLSELKYSVDTEEDFERVRQNYEELNGKIKRWGEYHGQNSAQRF